MDCAKASTAAALTGVYIVAKVTLGEVSVCFFAHSRQGGSKRKIRQKALQKIAGNKRKFLVLK